MRPRYPAWIQGFLVILIPVLLVLLTYMNFQFVVESPGGSEFLVGWISAKAWIEEGISPYNPAVRDEVQQSIYGRPANSEVGEFEGYFTPLHPAVLIYAPFTFLSLELARAIWMTIAEVGLLLLVIFGHRLADWRPNRFLLIGIFLFSLIWYHGARVAVMGSLSVIEAILISGAILAIQRENDWIAGLSLAVALIQPQYSILVVVFVCIWGISTRRWQLIISTLGFFVLLLGISTALTPSWPFEWIRQAIDLFNGGSTTSATQILANWFPQVRSAVQIGIFSILGIYLLWEWILAWGEDEQWFTWTASMTLAVSMLFIPHFSTEGYVVLLPVLVMLFGHWIGRWGTFGELTAWLSIIIFGLGLWSLFFMVSTVPAESSTLYFPVPTFCILGLLWVRWWVTKRQRGFVQS